jgi:hypothetical protein
MNIVRMKGSIFKSRPQSQHEVWEDFFANAELLSMNRVTEEELEILRDFSPLGVITCTGDILYILGTIRWANRQKPS